MHSPPLLLVLASAALSPELENCLQGFNYQLSQDLEQLPATDTLCLLDLSSLSYEQAERFCRVLSQQLPQSGVFWLLEPEQQPPQDLTLVSDFIFRPLRVSEFQSRIRRLWQRLRAETAGQSISDQGFHQVFEKHHAMMMLIDPQSGQIVDANPAATRFYGYDRESLKKMQIQQINLLQDHEVNREMQRARQGVYNYFSFLHRLATGEVRTVEVHSTPLELSGKPILFSIIHDITQRRKAEEALRQSEEQYRQLFEIAPLGIGVADRTGQLLAFNDAMLQPGGYTREDILELGQVGKLYYDPVDREEILGRFLREGRITREEVRFRKRDGSPYESLLTLAPIRFGGQPCLLALVEDITERKQAERALQQSEALYRQIVETAEEGFWIIDEQNITRFVNQKMADMLGYETPEEVLGKSLFDFMDEEGLQISQQNLDRRRQGISEVHDFKLLTRAGQVLWTSMSTSPIHDVKGDYSGAMALVTDITERKRNEEQIQQALHEREILLREIHHRVKNNFQVVISLLNLQARKLSDRQAIEPLIETRNRIRSMALLHERIYQSNSLVDVDFSEYLQFLTRELYLPGPQQQATQLSFQLAPVLLTIDQAIPCGLLVNELLTNAFKYAFPPDWQAERKVEILLQKTQDTILLQIQDNGIGFPEDLQAEPPRSLGLQLIQQLIRQLDGDYELLSQGGTCWKIRFPLQQRSAYPPFSAN